MLECPDAQCGDIPAGDRVAAYVTQRGKTTYVTYTTNGLPLTNLIRDVVPFGNVIADLTEPVLTAIVNSAYPNGNPIPADPSEYQPATPFSSLIQLATTVTKTATTGSAPKTASQTAITATDPTPSDKKTPATLKEKPKPLTNIVRDSEKAEPQAENDEGTSASASDPVATVDKPKKDDKQETAKDEPKQSGADAEAGTS